MNHRRREPDEYASIQAACRRFHFSRSTFYRMLRAPDSDLEDLIVRVPPVTGRIRVPLRAFEEWLQRRGRGFGGAAEA